MPNQAPSPSPFPFNLKLHPSHKSILRSDKKQTQNQNPLATFVASHSLPSQNIVTYIDHPYCPEANNFEEELFRLHLKRRKLIVSPQACGPASVAHMSDTEEPIQIPATATVEITGVTTTSTVTSAVRPHSPILPFEHITFRRHQQPPPVSVASVASSSSLDTTVVQSVTSPQSAIGDLSSVDLSAFGAVTLPAHGDSFTLELLRRPPKRLSTQIRSTDLISVDLSFVEHFVGHIEFQADTFNQLKRQIEDPTLQDIITKLLATNDEQITRVRREIEAIERSPFRSLPYILGDRHPLLTYS